MKSMHLIYKDLVRCLTFNTGNMIWHLIKEIDHVLFRFYTNLMCTVPCLDLIVKPAQKLIKRSRTNYTKSKITQKC